MPLENSIKLPKTRFWSFLGLLWSDTDQNMTGRFLPVSPSFLAGPEPPETTREGENRVQSSYLKFLKKIAKNPY